ncbi:MAG: YjbQ family protein [Epsilonproteobacteria bacterium]|nr:YjbQ family protein [Campylobacterota bacterium]
MQTIKLKTKYKTQMIDITEQVAEEVVKLGVRDGLCNVFSTHTTASIVFFENHDPKLQRDFLAALSRIAPNDFNYTSSDINAAAHIKSTLCGQRVVLPVVNGQLFLGKWQGIYFCEFDGPRDNREFHIQVI